MDRDTDGLGAFLNGHWTSSALGREPLSNVRTIFEDSEHVLWIAIGEGLAFRSLGRVEVPASYPIRCGNLSRDYRGWAWITLDQHFRSRIKSESGASHG